MRSYRASSLGSCTKAQIALQLGYTPLEIPDKVETIYARGRDHEVECVAAMEAEGWVFTRPGIDSLVLPNQTLLATDENQWFVTLEVAGAQVTGHLDGLGYWASGPDARAGVIEIKSPQSFHKWERAHKTGDYSDPLMNRYAWQISVYMAATGLEAVVACVEDGQVRTFGIEVAPVSLEDIEFLVGWMEGHVKEGILPGVCSQADYPCPVAYLHEKAELEEDPLLDLAVDHYAWATNQVKKAKEVVDKSREKVLELLAAREGTETASSKVTRYTTTRKSYDYDAMERDGIDLAKYVTEKESESVRITKKVDE